ncbi:MAG: GPW/gp25 family protein, partial [Moorea sp. SIO2I5]|nr:GPW/gp25 family protein [Moorena sp. SIO2I5]
MTKPFLGVGVGFALSLNTQGDFQLAEYEESVRQSILIILGTARGERIMRPDFGCGIYDLVFEPNSAATTA